MPIKFFLFILSLVTSGYLLTQTNLVQAVNGPPGQQSPSVDCLRGWGLGDKNHKHCGPPGTSMHPPPPFLTTIN